MEMKLKHQTQGPRAGFLPSALDYQSHEGDPAQQVEEMAMGTIRKKKSNPPTFTFLRALGMILVPQKYVGDLQPFPVNVGLFSSPQPFTSSAWQPFLLPAFLPQQQFDGSVPMALGRAPSPILCLPWGVHGSWK